MRTKQSTSHKAHADRTTPVSARSGKVTVKNLRVKSAAHVKGGRSLDPICVPIAGKP